MLAFQKQTLCSWIPHILKTLLFVKRHYCLIALRDKPSSRRGVSFGNFVLCFCLAFCVWSPSVSNIFLKFNFKKVIWLARKNMHPPKNFDGPPSALFQNGWFHPKSTQKKYIGGFFLGTLCHNCSSFKLWLVSQQLHHTCPAWSALANAGVPATAMTNYFFVWQTCKCSYLIALVFFCGLCACFCWLWDLNKNFIFSNSNFK